MTGSHRRRQAVALALLALSVVLFNDCRADDQGGFGRGGKPQPPAEQPLAKVSVDELIAKLPKAGCEARFDMRTGEGVIDPASTEMEWRIKEGLKLNDAQWKEVLLKTGAITTWPKWPVEDAFAISMIVPRWLELAQIRARPQNAGLRPAEVGETMMGFSGTGPAMRAAQARYQQLGKLELGKHTITFDVEIERGRSLMDAELDEAHKIIWKGTVALDVDVVATMDEALPPVHDKALDAAVADSIGAGFRTWGNLGEVGFVVVDPNVAMHPELADLALSLTVELLEDGQVIETKPLVASRLDPLSTANSVSKASLRHYGSNNFTAAINDAAHIARYSLRVRGDAKYVRGLWDARRRWDGQIEMRLKDTIALEVMRTGAEGRGPEVSTPVPRTR